MVDSAVTMVGSTELRSKIRDILERVKYGGEHIVITNFGRPMAVLLGFDEYQELIRIKRGEEHQPLQRAHDPE